MSSISDMIEGVKRIDALLADADLEPNADRADWLAAKKKVEALREALSEEITPRFDDALKEADGTDLAAMIRRRTAHLYADSAAVLQASGDGIRAAELLHRAASAAVDDEHKEELAAAQKEPAVFARLILSRWHLSEGRFKEADRAAERVRKEAKQRPLANAAKEILNGPRPLTGSPPSMFTVNGFGTRLYGERDMDSEGRYIATLCFCALFIPVFPIAAYRVKAMGDRSYRFYAKEKLSPFARTARLVIGAAAVCAGVSAYVSSWLDSPSHKADVAMEAAQALEKKGDDAAALEAYAKVVSDFPAVQGAGRDAAEGIARLAAKRIPTPCTVDGLAEIRREAGSFTSLPVTERSFASATPLVKRLDACAAEIGDADDAKARTALRVMDLAAAAAEETSDATWVEERRNGARRAYAMRSADARPLLALVELVKLKDKESLAAAKKVILDLKSESLLHEAATDVETWAHNARNAGDDPGATLVRAQLSEANKTADKDLELLKQGDEKAIASAATAQPDDQILAAYVAAKMRAHGDDKRAIELLTKLGPPGRLTAEAQEMLANAHAATGDLVKADEILTALVDERLPAFQDAQRAYQAAAEKAQRRITGSLGDDRIPSDLEARLQGIASEDKKREEAQAWLSEKMAADPELTLVRAEYIARGDAVPAALELGMVKLQRAASAGGDERKKLLAQAEQAFLAIRDEASGDPRFHLGLAQVYHRLGKTEEGEAEMKSVIERKDAQLTLRVAETYRSLGLYSRARQVARSVYDQPGVEIAARHQAAHTLALLALDVDEEEDWLRRGDTESAEIRVALDHVQGERLRRDGKGAEADLKFKKCADYYAQSAKTNAVSANNAATETMDRYFATGDVTHLKNAVSYLDQSTRLDPDEALILGNLIGGLWQLSEVEVLGKWVDARALAMEPDETRTLLGAVLDGPLAADAIEAMRANASFQRALTLSRKHQVLAPQARSAYRVTTWWLGATRDAKALEELDRRLQMLPGTSESDADVREKWLSGEQDERALREAIQEVARAHRRVDRVKSASKATQAAAWMLLAEAIDTQIYFKYDAALADEMVDAIRKARAAWPEGATRSEASSMFFTAALYRALDGSPSLRKAWEDERRVFGRYDVVYRALNGPASVEIAAALRKEPLLAESVAARKQGMGDAVTLSDFIFARVAGDAELEQLATKVFERRDTDLLLSIEARIAPNDKAAAWALALFRGRGKATDDKK